MLGDFGVDMRTTILFVSLSERFGFLGRCRQCRLLRLASIVNTLLSSVQFINCCCQVFNSSIVAVKCSIHQLLLSSVQFIKSNSLSLSEPLFVARLFQGSLSFLAAINQGTSSCSGWTKPLRTTAGGSNWLSVSLNPIICQDLVLPCLMCFVSALTQ